MALETLNPWFPNSYTGAVVSPLFMRRWRSRKYTGAAKPWARVTVRRGYMHHRQHSQWPGSDAPLTVRGRTPKPFGRLVGRGINDQWYPDWTPTSDWVQLPGVAEIDLSQSVNYAGGQGGDGSGGSEGSNGICVATVTCDNEAWVQAAGELGAYHTKQRGWLWPWRGWVPTNRPGGASLDQNEWYDALPNAQIMVEQGYGEDAAVRTFTGLIDSIDANVRPDRATLTCRDFGGALVDVNPWAWNRDPRLRDPFYFIPPNYPGMAKLKTKANPNWVIVDDATDIVRCALRWCGFKEWEIEDAGVQLKTALLVDRSGTWMDVVNEVAAQLGYVFFVAEPTNDDLSIGVPVFRKQSVLHAAPSQPTLLDSTMLTDVHPKHDNKNDRHIIRVRGRFAKRSQGGRPILGGDMTVDGQVLYTFAYWPPWMPKMSGIIKQLTYYNIGSNGVLGFSSTQECAVACVLIAVQIALTRDTAVAQCPANPAIGLDGFAFISDRLASGITSRLYVTSRKTTMTLGGDGTSSAGGDSSSGSNQLYWSSELSGSLCDNPEWEHLISDYNIAIAGGKVVSSGGTGQWD